MIQSSTDLSTNNGFSLLLLGEYAAGKTTLAGMFDSPIFVSNDQKLESIPRVLGKEKKFWFNDPNIGPDKKELPNEAKWPQFIACCKEAFEHKESKTVVIDGLTRCNDWLQSYLVSQTSAVKDLIIGGQKCMTQNHWYPFQTIVNKTIASLKTAAITTGKHLIVTGHVRLIRDEQSGATSLKPMIGGSTADTLGSWFTDVWLLLNESMMPDAAHPDGVRRVCLTTPQPKIQLCCSRKLPAKFEFNWKDFEASKV